MRNRRWWLNMYRTKEDDSLYDQGLGRCCLTIAALLQPVFSMQKQRRLLTDSSFYPWQITRFQSNCYWRCYQRAEAASEPSAAWRGAEEGRYAKYGLGIINYPTPIHTLPHTPFWPAVRWTAGAGKCLWPLRAEDGMRIGKRARTREINGEMREQSIQLDIFTHLRIIELLGSWRGLVYQKQHSCLLVTSCSLVQRETLLALPRLKGDCCPSV